MSKGKFLCNWCGKMKPAAEKITEFDENEFPTWIGCKKCHKRRG